MKPINIISSLLPLTLFNLLFLLIAGFFGNQVIGERDVVFGEPTLTRILVGVLVVVLSFLSISSLQTIEKVVDLKRTLGCFFSFALPIFLCTLIFMYFFAITSFGREMFSMIGSSAETPTYVVLFANYFLGFSMMLLSYILFLLGTNTYRTLFLVPGLYLVALFFSPLIIFPNLILFPIYCVNNLLMGRL
jgi:hypothetical protein